MNNAMRFSMMTMKVFLAAFMISAVCGCARTNDTDATEDTADLASTRFDENLNDFIDMLGSTELRPVGFVVIAVHEDEIVYSMARGVRNIDSGAEMTLDTPVYIASTTKAHNGLLAALLDSQDVLPVDSTLADVWPNISLLPPLVAGNITAASLLSHSSGVRAGGLVHRSNTTGDVTSDEVPIHLSTYAQQVGTDFSYSNMGPFVYSAMVESRTGLPWRDTIKAQVFDRLELNQTSARLEDFSSSDVAHCHTWRDGRWVAVPHKPTKVLNAGGGIYSSANDIAKFLEVFVDPELSQNDAELANAAKRSWETEVSQDRVTWGLHRVGYGLGWDIGDYDGKRFVARSGGYWGCRSIALFLPGEAFGIAVISVGDLATNSFNSAIVRQAIDIWTNAPDRTESRIEEYVTIASEEIARVANDDVSTVNEISLPVDEKTSHLGNYVNARLGTVEISQIESKLVVRSGVFVGDLLPLGNDQFRLMYRGPDISEHFEVLRREDGAIVGVLWDDDRYNKTDN